MASLATADPKYSNDMPADVLRGAIRPGERLTYSISWSRVLEAGVAVLEVSNDKAGSGRPAYRIVSTAKTVGIVKTFYPVSDVVESLIDAGGLYSLSYKLNQKHGNRKKNRTMVFDHENRIVHTNIDGKIETHSIPESVQDPLSSLYYIRTLNDLKNGSTIVIDVFEKDKNWSVDVIILGREKIKTILGETNTIKLKTYPKYEGVFRHKGEIYIWLTDDIRRIPVLMKSTVSIGSIVAVLTDIKHGDEYK